jgi:hypothetical protein
MTQENTPAKRPAVDSIEPAMDDLSEAINQSVERQPDEEVRSVRVFGDRYRCNWWVRQKTTDWMGVTTGVIRKSKFLRATQVADRLVIEDLSSPR